MGTGVERGTTTACFRGTAFATNREVDLMTEAETGVCVYDISDQEVDLRVLQSGNVSRRRNILQERWTGFQL